MIFRQHEHPDDMFTTVNRQWFDEKLLPRAKEMKTKDWSVLVDNNEPVSEVDKLILKKVIEYRKLHSRVH